MQNLYLYVIVFVSGAAVLAIELLGTRVLGPFYGVSLFLWSALITVTLVALSVGYAVGGRWADRGPSFTRLCYPIAGAGLWLLLLPWLRIPVLQATEPIGLRFAVLAAAFLLFAPPLTLLGVVSPYAIRLRASSLGKVGRTAGDLYAISTIGGVFAALLTGFVLIPSVGVGRLIVLVGLTLLGTSLVGLLVVHRSVAVSVTLGGILLLGGLGLAALPSGTDPAGGLISLEHSPYAELRVVDQANRRHLLIDGGTHSSVDPTTYVSDFPYVHVLDVTRYLFPEPGNLLLIGLGGGSVAKAFARHGWRIDSVEIDRVVTEIAYRDFGLTASETEIFHMDGRRYLTTTDERYDVIIVDAFGSSSIPFHLVTREAFALMAARLEPGGVVAINVESIGWRDILVRALAATMKQEFSEVLALPIAEPPNTLGNLVLLAANRELELIDELPPTRDRFSNAYPKNHAWDNRFEPDLAEVSVLTDDLNPVDIWSERINLAARKDLHAYFEHGLSW